MTSTQDLGWLLANFADRVPGVAHAIARFILGRMM